MPRYEFECRECGHEFAIWASYSEKKGARCPECDSDALKEHYGLAVGGGSGGSGRSTGGDRPRFT